MSPLLKDYMEIVALLIPAVEIVIAGMLLYHRTRRLGLYASFMLMLLFTAYIIIILNYASYVPCSCGGIINKLGWEGHLWFNSLFTVLAGVSYYLYPRSKH